MKRAILFTVLMIVLRCGDDNGTGTDNNPGNIDDPGITTGTASFVVVEKAGQWHKDTLTQTVVSSHFTGDTLVITRLIAIEPAAPVEGIPFLMESRKGGRIKIGVHRSGDERVLLFGWGYFSGAGNGSSDSLRWIGIAPEYADTDTVIFDIPEIDSKGLYRRAASSWQGFSRFSLSVVKAGSPAATTLSDLHVLAARAFLTFLDSLPVSLATQTNALSKNTHRYSLTMSSDSYYKGLWHILGVKTPRCLVALSANAREGLVAHEMGHYFSHLLVGDEKYAQLEDLAPDYDHGLGVVHAGRTTITEEYAYFTEYFLTGAVNAVADPLSVQIFLGSHNKPSLIDMPSVEGFGTILLALLQHSRSSIIDFEKKKDTLPILGASFGALYEVLAKGPANINELRDGLSRLCSAHSFDTGWQICAERAGWSYNGHGTITDANGKVIENVKVFCALPVNGKLKLSSPAVMSDSKGLFTIPRLYPGKSRLYAVNGSDTTSVEVEIAWDKETNISITLPTITLSQLKLTTITPLQRYEGDTITLTGKGFGITRGTSAVLFGAKKAVSYPSWSDTLIKAIVPNGSRPGSVTVTTGSSVSNALPFTVLSKTARDLRKAAGFIVSWRGTHDFQTASGNQTMFESFTVATEEIGSNVPGVTWSNDSFHVQFDGRDVMQSRIQFSIKGNVNAWGDTLLGLIVDYTRMQDTCETGAVVPTYSFSYSLKNIRLYDYNTTLKRVLYRVAGEAIAANISNQSMTSISCTGASSYLSTRWSEGAGTTDIEVYFKWE